MILSNSLQRDFCGDLNEFGLSDAELLPSIYPSARVIFHPNRYRHNTSYVILMTFEVGLLSFDHFTSVKSTVYPKLCNFAMCQSEKINTTKTFAQTLVPMWWKIFFSGFTESCFSTLSNAHRAFYMFIFFVNVWLFFTAVDFFSLLLTLPVYLSCCHRP